MTKINLLQKDRGHGHLTFLFACLLIALLMSNFSDAWIGGAWIDQGLETAPGEFPAVVGFKGTSRSAGLETENTCTGFFVTPRLILTAAHCLKGQTVYSVSNGIKLRSHEAGARSFDVEKSNAHPDYSKSSEPHPFRDPITVKSIASDVGYLVLKKDATDIKPYPLYLSNGKKSDASLLKLPVTVVGYGADRFADVQQDEETRRNDPSGTGTTYYASKIGTKKKGTRVINAAYPEGVYLQDGDKFGPLPGDSGGPILSDLKGVPTIIALNHSYQPAPRSVQKPQKFDRKGRPKPLEYEEVIVYDYAVGTLLTLENLCWVVRDSGQSIPDVTCPPASP